MKINRCMKCMNPISDTDTLCPHCGHSVYSVPDDVQVLRPGTILNGTYLVGEVLGQGGFGITYIGFDLLLQQKVAIKEYFPTSTGAVTRQNSSTVLWSKTSNPQQGFDRFLKEARKMAKLGSVPNVVGVKAVFIQNNTAYIVMEYVDGETLLSRVKRTGPMAFSDCVRLVRPIVDALAEVHRHGIIHRDISPDNIMLGQDGKPYLLDLGAAKDLEYQTSGSQSTNLVVKHGFSPVEQYMQKSPIGPWTDVYAMSATIYYCCTGVLPPVSLDRLMQDTLAPHPALTALQFQVLSSGMAVKTENRIQNMDILRAQLDRAGIPAPPQRPSFPKWIPAAAAACLVLIGVLTVSLFRSTDRDDTPAGTVQMEAGPTRPPQTVPPASELPIPSETDPEINVPPTTEAPTTPTEDRTAPAHTHTWQAATWHGPRMCTGCGETEGTADISAGDVVTFGRYEQDNNKSNGPEALEWKVLSVQDGAALLITDKVVDSLPYHDKLVNITWENCTLRSWLNKNFYDSAFRSQETQAILSTMVDNSASQGKSSYPTKGGNDTTDKVFLLSYLEAQIYFGSESSRICSNTPYAAARAAANIPNSDNGRFDQSWWWLRSPGDAQTNAMTVFRDGKNRVDLVSNSSGQVRPAIWVNINTPELDF